MTTTSGYTFPVQNPATNPNNFPEGTYSYGDWNGDVISYLQYLGDHGDESALDRLYNYLLSERSAGIAREWTASREDTQYQRLVADMKAAGLNPYAFATFGGSPISSSSSGNSYGGNYYAANQIDKEKNRQNWLKVALSAALPIIGAAIAAML